MPSIKLPKVCLNDSLSNYSTDLFLSSTMNIKVAWRKQLIMQNTDKNVKNQSVEFSN